MNGKGSSPRNNYSKQFRTNYSEINWSKPKSEEDLKRTFKRTDWESEYKELGIEWEDFRENYYKCHRCNNYQKSICICICYSR